MGGFVAWMPSVQPTDSDGLFGAKANGKLGQEFAREQDFRASRLVCDIDSSFFYGSRHRIAVQPCDGDAGRRHLSGTKLAFRACLDIQRRFGILGPAALRRPIP